MSEQSTFNFEDSQLRRQYQEWRQTRAGQAAYALCRRYALEKLERRQAFGIAQLAERVRWDAPVAIEKDAAGYKVNNNFRAYIARELIEEIPALKPYIELRRVSVHRRGHAHVA